MGLKEDQDKHTDEGLFLERNKDFKESVDQIGLFDSAEEFKRFVCLQQEEFGEGDIKIVYDPNKPEQLVISFDKFATWR